MKSAMDVFQQNRRRQLQSDGIVAAVAIVGGLFVLAPDVPFRRMGNAAAAAAGGQASVVIALDANADDVLYLSTLHFQSGYHICLFHNLNFRICEIREIFLF